MQYAMTIPATGRSRIVVSSILAFRTSALRGNERANFARVSEDHVRAVILRCWRTSEFISYLALEITSDKSSYRNQSLPEVKCRHHLGKSLSEPVSNVTP